MNIKNYTPHTLHIHVGDDEVITLAPDGPAPRLSVERKDLGCIAGIPLVRSTMGSPTGLPDPEPGVVLVVSALVAEACPERDDLAYPGEAIRDDQGRVIGARGLCAGPGMAAAIEGRVALEGQP